MSRQTRRRISAMIWSCALATIIDACTTRSEHYGTDAPSEAALDRQVGTDASPPLDDVFIAPDLTSPTVDATPTDSALAVDARDAQPIDVGADPCGAHLDCATCTPASGCGWCSTDNHCYSGTRAGSATTACAGTAWAYVTSECTDAASRCGRYATCDACAAVAGCGWCSAANACSAGDSTGPTGASCASWHYTRASCSPPSPCATHTDCMSCATASGCGFCHNRGGCYSGTMPGPDDGECTGSAWSWTTATCM